MTFIGRESARIHGSVNCQTDSYGGPLERVTWVRMYNEPSYVRNHAVFANFF